MIRHMFAVGKAHRDPQECFWRAQSVCFCTSLHFLSFVLSTTPSSHRQAARTPPPPPPPPFWVVLKGSICILSVSKKWLPSQLLSPCLADKRRASVDATQTKYIWLPMPPPCLCHSVLRNATSSPLSVQNSQVNTRFVNHSATIRQL